jgi:hypothetical protein
MKTAWARSAASAPLRRCRRGHRAVVRSQRRRSARGRSPDRADQPRRAFSDAPCGTPTPPPGGGPPSAGRATSSQRLQARRRSTPQAGGRTMLLGRLDGSGHVAGRDVRIVSATGDRASRAAAGLPVHDDGRGGAAPAARSTSSEAGTNEGTAEATRSFASGPRAATRSVRRAAVPEFDDLRSGRPQSVRGGGTAYVAGRLPRRTLAEHDRRVAPRLGVAHVVARLPTRSGTRQVGPRR